MKQSSFNILIVKIAAIGDVVMSLPLLSLLREKYPTARITWVSGKQVQPLLEATRLIDQLITVDEKQLLKGNFFSKVSSLVRIWRKIAGRHFDLAFTLHPDPRYRWIAYPIFCKDRKYWGKNSLRFYPVPGRYHAQEYVNLLQKESEPVEQRLKFPSLTMSPSNARAHVQFDVVIAPGGAKNVLADDALRRWPIEHYVALIQRLSAHNLQIAVTGSKEDAWVLPFLEGLSFVNLIGKIDVMELISTLQKSRLLITHDSGPLHLAKLAQCQVLALFGPTNPLEKVSLEEKVQVLWGGEKLSCRPCYNGKSYAPCHKNLCLLRISPESVYLNALSLLS